jgi:transposase
VVAADDKAAAGFLLSGGNAHDAPKGREPLSMVGRAGREGAMLLMDRAHGGAATRGLAESLGYVPAVPPKRSRRHPWEFDRELYKRGNEVERFFRRCRRCRRICTRYDKLGRMFVMFFLFCLICDALL